MMDDREVVLIKMEDPSNAVEFRNATLAWEKARPPFPNVASPPSKLGGMKRVLRREKLRLYISTDDSKEIKDLPNAQSLLTNMEQESPQSTISSSQSIRPPLHKILHRIDIRIKKVTIQMYPRRRGIFPECLYSWLHMSLQGSVVGICGGVGSGKSSLLSALLGQVSLGSFYRYE